MEIRNCEVIDLYSIKDLYRLATEYMISKNQVAWPEFPNKLIEEDIREHRLLKIVIDNQIACIWTIAFSDELIWDKLNDQPAVYIHRIATNPDFRGRNLVGHIVKWADAYCRENQLSFVRMDTVGLNQGLINHYKKLGFDFLGSKKLEKTEGLPAHYKEGEVCFFQRVVL